MVISFYPQILSEDFFYFINSFKKLKDKFHIMHFLDKAIYCYSGSFKR